MMDYNSIPFRNRDIDVITKTKETPNRTVTKKIIEGAGMRTVVKDVENRRGSKNVVNANGARTVTKSYGKNAEVGTGIEHEPKVTRGQVRRWSKYIK